MKKRKEFRCVECGEGRVRPLAKAGRQTRHKTMTLELPADLEVPTCDRCGAEWYDDTTAREVDEALEGIYRHELRERVRAAIDTLTEHVSQRKMERMLGLSHGYLSKLRNGAVDPSPELVGNLALLARDPKKRIRELIEYWGAADDDAA